MSLYKVRQKTLNQIELSWPLMIKLIYISETDDSIVSKTGVLSCFPNERSKSKQTQLNVLFLYMLTVFSIYSTIVIFVEAQIHWTLMFAMLYFKECDNYCFEWAHLKHVLMYLIAIHVYSHKGLFVNLASPGFHNDLMTGYVTLKYERIMQMRYNILICFMLCTSLWTTFLISSVLIFFCSCR